MADSADGTPGVTSEERTFSGKHGEQIFYTTLTPASPRGLVVVAHGLGEHGGRYAHVAKVFTDAGFSVAIPDHLGHGRSGGKRLRIKSFKQFSDDLDTVITQTAIDGLPTYLLGHSMGGCIALDYALDHQDKLDGLILSGAAVMPGDDMPGPVIAVSQVLGKVAPWLPTIALDSTAVSRDPDVVAAYQADPLVTRARIPARLGAEMLSTMQSFPDRVGSLTIPLLVMHGSADRLTNPAGSEMVERLAGSDDKTLVIFDDLYHEIFNEPEQDKVLSTTLGWLEGHVTQAQG
ncbi:hydrolase [Gordonia sp. 852002-50816_SCH5313054-c]|uniref:alpha/beta hydrolase n=1 Tax=unclassified Gordonia (in: high G+C Gram-positive bacteria) TaxID=2657482 RepID=UPI0007E9A1D4|nr:MULTISPECIES: alpha/beta hydrolase [unclassified Gordonia (in: high G+C Gram-positive bacteria)]OBC14046.1 hydrolase [Gordonia sp. 852002-50816_SCH5313054-c]OBC15005.1 hydrolase [Gordonia sp. 852002-50816_SCH5313054-a]